jgi:hypothetical protein
MFTLQFASLVGVPETAWRLRAEERSAMKGWIRIAGDASSSDIA